MKTITRNQNPQKRNVDMVKPSRFIFMKQEIEYIEEWKKREIKWKTLTNAYIDTNKIYKDHTISLNNHWPK